MSALEGRYRAALRWYPRSWRARNQNAVVGTLLDVADGEGRSRPRPFEITNLRVHGLAARVRMVPSVVPSTLRDRTATAALAVGAAIALASIMQLESDPTRAVAAAGREYATFGPFASPMIIVYLVWIVALLAAIVGGSNFARCSVLATIPMTIAARLVADATDMLMRPTSTFLGILILLALLAAAGAPAPSRAGVRWLLIWFLSALTIFTFPQLIMGSGELVFQDPLWLARPMVLAWSPVVAVIVAAVLSLIGLRWWSATVLLISVPFIAAAIFGGHPVATEVAGWLILVALTVATAAVLLRAFGFRLQLQRVPQRGPSR